MPGRTRNRQIFSNLWIGNRRIQPHISATVAVDPPSIAAGATSLVAVTIAGLAAGDLVVLEPPALATGLVYSGHVVSANTVTIRLTNITGGAIDDTSKTWTYKVVKA